MFGYVRPEKPEMKIREYEAYKAIYCSLCRSLGKEYGVFARFALNYDCTFLVLLYHALHPTCVEFEKKRCTCNPLKSCRYVNGPQTALHYGATATVLMTEQKLRDTVSDENFFRRWSARWMLWLTRASRKKAAKADPELHTFLQEQMAKQQSVEGAEVFAGLDPAADASGKMLEYLLTRMADDPRSRSVLSVLGYQMGRWVYFMDAADDLEKDLQRDSFNPFVLRYGLSRSSSPETLREVREEANHLLNACVAQILSAYQLLEFQQSQPILTNILELGLAAAQRKMIMREEKNHVRSV